MSQVETFIRGLSHHGLRILLLVEAAALILIALKGHPALQLITALWVGIP